MSAADSASKEAAAWFVEADHVSVTALARRRSRARIDEERAKSGRIVIVASLFLVLLAAALLVGGHAAIDPLLRSTRCCNRPRRRGRPKAQAPSSTPCPTGYFAGMCLLTT
jgi:hypothetical protein